MRQLSTWLGSLGGLQGLYQLLQYGSGYEQRIAFEVYAIIRDATLNLIAMTRFNVKTWENILHGTKFDGVASIGCRKASRKKDPINHKIDPSSPNKHNSRIIDA